MQVGAILTTGAGALLLLGGPYPLWLFFVGGIMVYMGTIVLEGVSMSLVSKVGLPCAYSGMSGTAAVQGCACLVRYCRCW